ncbi:MAG: hypothetical protein ABIN48_01260 [Ginsengibacter sp.]
MIEIKSAIQSSKGAEFGLGLQYNAKTYSIINKKIRKDTPSVELLLF